MVEDAFRMQACKHASQGDVVRCLRRSGVNRVELERAKRAAVSVICNALESKATSAEDIGRQYLTYGHRCVGAARRSRPASCCVACRAAPRSRLCA
jgi:hypothetical protein